MIFNLSMGTLNENKNILITWKEIAVYLKIDTRTCRRWEKELNLPIRRFRDSPKSRVYAYKNEIDDWLLQEKPLITSDNKKQSNKVLLKRLIFPFTLCIFIIIPAAIITKSLHKDNQPFGIEIQNSNLKVKNKDGKLLWTYNTEIKNLIENEYYQNHLNYKREEYQGGNFLGKVFPYVIVKDINADGKNEVIFCIQTQDDTNEKILCFNYEGEVLWDFDPGSEVQYGIKTYSKDFYIKGFDVADFENDGRFEIIVINNHKPDFPTQLVILDSSGKRKGEYWNAGRLVDFVTHDLNTDGVKELIIGGMNNEYNLGCLIAFDYKNIKGGSPQLKKKYTNINLARGSEKFYLLLPRTEVDKLQDFRETIFSVDIRSNEKILIQALRSKIYFEFNFRFEQPVITLSDTFRSMHREAKLKGEVNSQLDDEYMRKLSDSVLYWNGRNWTHEVSMANDL